MKRAHVHKLCLLALIVLLPACNLPTNPEIIQQYIAQTHTTEAISTHIPAADSRCNLFSSLDLSVFLYDLYPTSASLTMYVKFPEGVIGLEDGFDDGAPWEYSATLGDVHSIWCALFEGEDYAGRLYCLLPLPREYHNAAKPLTVHVNLCDQPIVEIPKQSIVIEAAPAVGSSGDSSNESSGIGGIQAIFEQFTILCGGEPPAHSFEPDNGYRDWCHCMGGDYSSEEWFDMAGNPDGMWQYCTFP